MRTSSVGISAFSITSLIRASQRKTREARGLAGLMSYAFTAESGKQADIVGQRGDDIAGAGMGGAHIEAAGRRVQIRAAVAQIQDKALVAGAHPDIGIGVIARAVIFGVLLPLMADIAADREPVIDGVGGTARLVVAGAAAQAEGRRIGPGAGQGQGTEGLGELVDQLE